MSLNWTIPKYSHDKAVIYDTLTKGRHQNMKEILYLYSVKIGGGGGPQILSCKDSELIAEKVFSLHIDGLRPWMTGA